MNKFSLLTIIFSVSVLLSLLSFTQQLNFLAEEEDFQDYDMYVLSINWGSKKTFFVFLSFLLKELTMNYIFLKACFKKKFFVFFLILSIFFIYIFFISLFIFFLGLLPLKVYF